MGSTLTDDQIRRLRKLAKAAEPYPDDHPEHPFNRDLDGPPRSPEGQARVDATMARYALELEKIPIEE